MARLQIKRKVTICRPGFVRSLDGDGEHWNVYVVAVFLIFIFICFAWGTFEHWNVYIVAVFLTLIFNLLWIGWWMGGMVNVYIVGVFLERYFLDWIFYCIYIFVWWIETWSAVWILLLETSWMNNNWKITCISNDMMMIFVT